MTRHYLTTPIYYVNDVPHVGHAYTTIAADVLTRARRLRGHEAFLLTGTDEHGQNIERIAREKGISEQQHCDTVAAEFQSLWKRYDIRYDDFIRTTEERHTRGVLALWARLREAKTPDGRDAVFMGTYKGWYCPRCEAFYDEEELRQPGNLCPVHDFPSEWTEEQNFFFRLSAYTSWLREEISTDRIKVEPEGRKNEVLAVIAQGLQDFSVSRARVKWGIHVPERPDHVLYVWFDALANYVTALGLGEAGEGRARYEQFWEGRGLQAGESLERMHLIGKDIIRFHCIYWPAILLAAGLPVPTRLFAQGWITKNGKKLSKSSGNVIDPVQLVEDFGSDAVRYFLLREGVYGQDWDFTDKAFLTRFNADLANDLGNLVSRTLTMVKNYCGGAVPPRPERNESSKGEKGDFGPDSGGGTLAAEVFGRFEALDFSGALFLLWARISRLNQSIAEFEPWVVAKDPSRLKTLQDFLYRLCEELRIITVLASPVLTRGADRVFAMLGLPPGSLASKSLAWGALEPGTSLSAVEPLFPRVERKKEKPVSQTEPPAPPAADGKIDISEFARVDLRAATIKAAEKIPGSKKLVRLEVDLGTESRQVVAGIAEAYPPETLVGKTIALVANLKPAKLMGVESNGMVLAASLDGKPVLLTFDAAVPPGTKIK